VARPSVSVVVPFVGGEAELAGVRRALSRLRRGPADELIVVDNRRAPATPRRVGALAPGAGANAHEGGVRILRASGVRTPAYARNAGARASIGEWLVFVDADTDPDPGLLDAYFAPTPDEMVGVLAGAVSDAVGADTVASRYGVQRGGMDQAVTMERRGTPYAQTSNCAVRRRAFEQIGGFMAEARAGEDADLCFRLARAGWTLESRPEARVCHRARATVRALVVQLARHGSGAAWLERRYPGEFTAPGTGVLMRRAVADVRAAARALARGDREEAAFAMIDLAGAVAFEGGRRLPNLRRH